MAAVNGDIELEIGAGTRSGDYQVRVVRALGGMESEGKLHLDVNEVLRQHDDLERNVLASAVPVRRVPTRSEQPVQEVGRRLFEALFSQAVRETYRASRGIAERQGKHLRVVLRLDAPELAALPWEALYDAATETYVCLDEPLVRHIPTSFTPEPLEVTPPLRILGVVASPKGLRALNVAAEKRRLAEALKKPLAEKLVDLDWVPEGSWDALQDRLLEEQGHPWHVLHFIGHGDYDPERDTGVLALVGRGGQPDYVEAGRLARLLGEADPIPRLAVLNSCSSGQGGTTDFFSSTGSALVQLGINAVVAMQYAISDSAAISFAHGLYTALARGRDIDQAVKSGRVAILGGNSLEWITPVLYLRGDAVRLFTFAQFPSPQPRGAEPKTAAEQITSHAEDQTAQPSLQNALLRMLVTARSEMDSGNPDAAISTLDDLLTLDAHYRDAQELRETARRRLRLERIYERAMADEDTGDWTQAVHGYAEVLQEDPTYRDAGDRRRRCEERERVAELQSELRRHAQAGQWQAVLDLSAEIQDLDATAADPDGLVSRARTALTAADQTHRYEDARTAEDAGDWGRAATIYAGLLMEDPAYRDAGHRRDACMRRLRVRDLESQLDKRGRTGSWQEVLRGLEELARVDPDSAARPANVALGAHARSALSTDRSEATSGPRSVPPIAASRQRQPVLRVSTSRPIYQLAWQPQRGCIAVASDSAMVQIWWIRGTTAAKDRGVKAGSLATVATSVAFGRNGALLATGTALFDLRGPIAGHTNVRIWEVATGKKLMELRQSHSVWSLAFDPDGKKLVTGGDDGTARLWDVERGNQLQEVRAGDPVRSVAFSADGTMFVTGSGKSARVWDATTGRPLVSVDHSGAVYSVAFAPVGTQLATGGEDHTACVWDAGKGTKLQEVRHNGSVRSVAFGRDGIQLATGSNDRTSCIWHVQSGSKLVEFPHEGAVSCVAFGPGGSRLASASGRTLQIWDVSV